MKLVKDIEGFSIYERRDGRFAVETSKGKSVNGEEKTAILLAQELIKVTAAKPVEAAPVEETEAAAE